MKNRQLSSKHVANAAYALKYLKTDKKGKPIRRKKARRDERHSRVLQREREWLRANGIERDDQWPLA